MNGIAALLHVDRCLEALLRFIKDSDQGPGATCTMCALLFMGLAYFIPDDWLRIPLTVFFALLAVCGGIHMAVATWKPRV